MGKNEHQPNTQEGKKLMVHELTHSLQQKQQDNTIQRSIGKGVGKAIETISKWAGVYTDTKSVVNDFFSDEDFKVIKLINFNKYAYFSPINSPLNIKPGYRMQDTGDIAKEYVVRKQILYKKNTLWWKKKYFVVEYEAFYGILFAYGPA